MMADESAQTDSSAPKGTAWFTKGLGFQNVTNTHHWHFGGSVAVFVFLMVALFTPSFVVVNNNDRSFFSLMCTNDQTKELTATLMTCPTSVAAVKILLPMATIFAFFCTFCILYAKRTDKKAEQGGEPLDWGSFTYAPLILEIISGACWITFFIIYMVKIDDMKFWDGTKPASHSLSYSEGNFFWLILVIWIGYFVQGVPQFFLIFIRIRIKNSINYGKLLIKDGISMVTGGPSFDDHARGVRHY